MKYYTYLTTNKANGMFYFGVHASNKIRDSYIGSGIALKEAIKKEGKENFKCEIQEYFNNPEDMLKRESEIVNEDWIKNPMTYNIILGGGRYNVLGCVVVKDKFGKTFMVSVEDPRYLSGELLSIHKGKISVRDKNGKTFQVDVNDPRSEEHTSELQSP